MGILQVLRLEFRKFRILDILNFHPWYFSIYVLQISIEYQVETDVILLKGRIRAPEGIFSHSIFDVLIKISIEYQVVCDVILLNSALMFQKY